jgi:hypothetical protein
VDVRVRSFEYEVAASGGLFLAVDEDPSFQGRKASNAEHSHRKALIGEEGPMCCQSLLTISTALHGSEYIHEVPPHRQLFGPADSANPIDASTISLSAVRRSISDVLGPSPARLKSLLTEKKRNSAASAPLSIPLDYAVKRRVTMLMYLATLLIGGVQFRPIPKLAGAP